MNLLGRAADRRLRLPVRHRLVAADRRDRLVVESDLGHDGGDAAAHLPDLPGRSAGPGRRYYVTALSVGAIVCIAASNGGTTSQDLKTGFLVGAHAALPADRDPDRRARLGARARADPAASSTTRPPSTCRSRRQVGAAGLTRRCRGRSARRRESAAAARRPTRDAQDLPASGTRPTPRAARPASTSSTTSGSAGLPRRSGHQRHARHAPGRQRGARSSTRQGDADVLHHQGHPRPRAAVGAGAVRRDDRARARDVGHPVAGLRGRRLPAALVLDADLRSAAGALAGRPPPAATSCAQHAS